MAQIGGWITRYTGYPAKKEKQSMAGSQSVDTSGNRRTTLTLANGVTISGRSWPTIREACNEVATGGVTSSMTSQAGQTTNAAKRLTAAGQKRISQAMKDRHAAARAAKAMGQTTGNTGNTAPPGQNVPQALQGKQRPLKARVASASGAPTS